jgi:hypothetical protein
VVVLSNEEYEELKEDEFPSNIDFLIIDQLSSSAGIYPDNGSIQARRLAAFLVSYHFKLGECLYLDDNIEAINRNGQGLDWGTWADVTRYIHLERIIQRSLLCGLKTRSNKLNHNAKQDYAYKLFAVDFTELFSVLNLQNANDVFVLGYPPHFASYCMQDYYFQIVMDFALQDKKGQPFWDTTHLITIPSVEQASLTRSNTEKNAAQARTTGFIEDIAAIDAHSGFVPGPKSPPGL